MLSCALLFGPSIFSSRTLHCSRVAGAGSSSCPQGEIPVPPWSWSLEKHKISDLRTRLECPVTDHKPSSLLTERNQWRAGSILSTFPFLLTLHFRKIPLWFPPFLFFFVTRLTEREQAFLACSCWISGSLADCLCLFGLMASAFLAARLFPTSQSRAERGCWGSFGDMTRKGETFHQLPEHGNCRNVKARGVEERGQCHRTRMGSQQCCWYLERLFLCLTLLYLSRTLQRSDHRRVQGECCCILVLRPWGTVGISRTCGSPRETFEPHESSQPSPVTLLTLNMSCRFGHLVLRHEQGNDHSSMTSFCCF